MIDRAARNKLADELRRLVDGHMTNDEFFSAYPDGCEDAAVAAVWEYGDWLYSDIPTYRLTGRHAPSTEARRVAMCCIWFLHTDLPYEWPPSPQGVIPFWGLYTPGFHFLLSLPFLLLSLLSLYFGDLKQAAWLSIFPLIALAEVIHWVVTNGPRHEELRTFWASGDEDVWPFLRRSDYEQARAAQTFSTNLPPPGS
jgi:hypothetical protein